MNVPAIETAHDMRDLLGRPQLICVLCLLAALAVPQPLSLANSTNTNPNNSTGKKAVAKTTARFLSSRALRHTAAVAVAIAVPTVVVRIVAVQPHLGQPRRLCTTYRDGRPTTASVTPWMLPVKHKNEQIFSYCCCVRTRHLYVRMFQTTRYVFLVPWKRIEENCCFRFGQ